MIELEDRWENHEPQNMMVGEDEAITMKSTLTCKKSGMWIEPVSSGQDKKAAERILKEAILTYEMKQKYPGCWRYWRIHMEACTCMRACVRRQSSFWGTV